MARKVKDTNKNEVFLHRFRELVYEDAKSQDELAREFGASRQTVSKWMLGESIPDIDALIKMAKYYNVSADYLLGLSDTVSVDVNVKATMEYTGLSEAAVEWLHMGLDDFVCDGIGLDNEERKKNLDAASALIQTRAFSDMIHYLKEVSLEAYLEETLTIMDEEYSECDLSDESTDFRYAKKEDRDVVVANHIHVLKLENPLEKDTVEEMVKNMDDDTLANDVMGARLSAKRQNEVNQFHAAKAFNRYIDQLVKESYERARERLKKTRASRRIISVGSSFLLCY